MHGSTLQILLHPPIVKKADSNAGYALEIDSDYSQIKFWVYVSGPGWVSSAAVHISTNTWYHAAGTYDGSSITIYLDGQPQGSPTSVSGAIVPASHPLNIGRDPSTTNRFFEGLIDEVEIFNRSLTSVEIYNIYHAGSDGKCKSSATIQCDCYDIIATHGNGNTNSDYWEVCLSNNGVGSLHSDNTQNTYNLYLFGGGPGWFNTSGSPAIGGTPGWTTWIARGANESGLLQPIGDGYLLTGEGVRNGNKYTVKGKRVPCVQDPI